MASERSALDFFRQVDQQQYTDTMPLYPARILVTHCAFRGAMVGSTVALILSPIISVVRKRPVRGLLRTFLPTATCTAAIGVGYAPYNMSLDVAGVDDRAYRLSKNADQTKLDRYGLVGGASMGLLCVVLGTPGVTTVSAGIAAGTLTFAVEKVAKKYQLV